MSPFEKYLHAVLMRAQHEAREDGSTTVEAQHLLLAVAGEPEPSVDPLLASAGLDRDVVHGALEREFVASLGAVGVASDAYNLPRPSRLPHNPKIGTSAKLVIERCFSFARKKDMRPPHVLLGILSAEVGTVPRALALAGVDRDDLSARVRRALTTTEKE